MILEKLSVMDFRVFQGQHVFDLSPRTKYEKKRPIILFGGLNGAGKTSILTAVRLALYGKHSLGHGTSQKAYDTYLTNAIHRSRSSLMQANAARIELTFSYAHMGVLKHYTVKRHWMMQGNKVVERLSILENNEELNELNDEQCQGFLNELIPIGLSDLFFFDGEKIAEMAKDTGGIALGDSIKKLLGLDIINTLHADLSVLIRNESKNCASENTQNDIIKLENELSVYEEKATKELAGYEAALSEYTEAKKKLEILEQDLSSRGGAWAATREDEINKQAKLSAQKDQLQNTLRDALAGSYPLSIAADYAKITLRQLSLEIDNKRAKYSEKLIKKHLTSLEISMSHILGESALKQMQQLIQIELNNSPHPDGSINIIHDISDSAFATIEASINDSINAQNKLVKSLVKDISNIEEKLDKAGKNISRAPEEALIKPMIERIGKAQKKVAKAQEKQMLHIKNRKQYLRDAMDIVRKLGKLSESFSTSDEKFRTVKYARGAKDLLDDFSHELTMRKTSDLENEFIKSFQHLARKEDVSLRANICPDTFTVKLIGMDGSVINKNDLSAGEKQIYAIAMLEALARTSGRILPIIVDTPLGRLDSKHRSKLINNYFPHASHQMLILSTDTEVDEAFYSELSKDISHAFRLEYSPDTGSTTAHEGYFWRNMISEESSHAA